MGSILDTNDRLAIHTHGQGPYKLQSGKHFSRLENTFKPKISHILPRKTSFSLQTAHYTDLEPESPVPGLAHTGPVL